MYDVSSSKFTECKSPRSIVAQDARSVINARRRTRCPTGKKNHCDESVNICQRYRYGPLHKYLRNGGGDRVDGIKRNRLKILFAPRAVFPAYNGISRRALRVGIRFAREIGPRSRIRFFGCNVHTVERTTTEFTNTKTRNENTRF